MKKTITFLIVVCSFINVFAQNKKETFTEYLPPNFPKGLPVNGIGNPALKNHFTIDVGRADKFTNAFFDDRNFDGSKIYTIDSIPDIAYLIVNGIEFQNKKVLTKINNFKIKNIRKDSTYTFNIVRKDSVTNAFEYTDVKRKYQRPYARIVQEHSILAQDFFLFKINTLEPVRYRCTAYSPVLDIFNTEEKIEYSPIPRVMIDGRLQAKSFDYDEINLDDIEKIEVFGSADATNYFGQKARPGLISYTTKGSNFSFDWALSNTRVVGETEDDKGNWKMVVDTLFSNIEKFKEYRKSCLKANGAIYIINGNNETESINRKTIDMDGITNLRIVSGMKLKKIPLTVSEKSVDIRTEATFDNDTIFIETKRNSGFINAGTGNLSKIFSELKRLRKTTPDPTPLYFVDNQEITPEKLKGFKPKELEFVESLEGCDAISKYGKRAEFGVVIYRRRKME
jgi:hypothetical protein